MNNRSRFRTILSHWMDGRHGTDQLGVSTLMMGLVLSLLGSVIRSGTLSFSGLVFYAITLFRALSRNVVSRSMENRKFLELTGKWKLKLRQFFLRQRNRKEYKYFRCPRCRQLLRLRRGCGEKDITCAKCGHLFKQKA